MNGRGANEQWGGWGGYAARLSLLFFFPCSADHERDWRPCKVVFRIGKQYAECEKQQQFTSYVTVYYYYHV